MKINAFPPAADKAFFRLAPWIRTEVLDNQNALKEGKPVLRRADDPFDLSIIERPRQMITLNELFRIVGGECLCYEEHQIMVNNPQSKSRPGLYMMYPQDVNRFLWIQRDGSIRYVDQALNIDVQVASWEIGRFEN